MASKRELVRIVRTPDRRVLPDPTGKLAGRGAYVCPAEKCLQEAFRSRRLERALGLPLPASLRETLSQQVAGPGAGGCDEGSKAPAGRQP